MESTCKEQLHNNADCDEESQVMAECLLVPLILCNILQHFSNADLLTLSFVNKFWNYESRSLMRKRDRLTATLKLGDSLQSLTSFAACLDQMNVVPFSGISFMLTSEKGHECQPPSKEEPLDSSHTIILDRLQWKHLSVTYSGFCKKCKHFPAFLLLKTIMKDKCGILEELSLSLDSEARAAVIQEFHQHCSFPRLRVLKLGQLRSFDPLDMNTKNIKALVSFTPNLQELRVPVGCVDIRENVLEGTSAVLLTNCVVFGSDDQYCRWRIADVIRFERVRLVAKGHLNLRIFNTMIADLLQRSRTTLTSLCLHSVFAVPLMFYGICFDNVRKFTISKDDDQQLDPAITSLLKSFDFTRIFPNLDRVITGDFSCGRASEDSIKDIVDQGKALWKEPLPDRAVKIKHLSISETLDESLARFFAEMLPNVERLSLDLQGGFVPFELIWEHWAHLKELHVRNYRREYQRPPFRSWNEFRTAPNMDSEFCGIFPGEVAELSKMDDEYLRKVNIVPVKPSLSCLKDLRVFKYYFQPETLPYYSFLLFPPTLSITRVSGLIVFAKCPSLSVTFQTLTPGDTEELRHTKPYATIQHVGPNIWPWNDINDDD